jgi:hypothetical protein
MAEALENRTDFLIRNVVLAVTALIGVGLLIRLSLVRSYAYDELAHAHMSWLVSVGEVPYRDFAANHFPFLWMLMSPLLRVLPESSTALMILRGLALLLNGVFTAVLGTLICLNLDPKHRIWAVACFGIVVFSPVTMHFLIEFRPDALANALLFSALLWLRLRGSKNVGTGLGSGFVIGAAVLINTKYLLLPVVLGAVAFILHFHAFRRIWSFALAICLGFGAALLAGLLLMVQMNVPLNDVWRMVVTYNAAVEKTHAYGFGLARELMEHPIWFGYMVVGLIGCGAIFLRKREVPSSLDVAVPVFLAMNLAAATRPWKQYLASWLLLAAYLPARSLPPLLAEPLASRAQVIAVACVSTIAIIGLVSTGTVDPNGSGPDRVTQDRVIKWMVQQVPASGFVVTGFPLHPVFRRDSFFKVVIDPTIAGGDGLEIIIPRLAPPNYAEHFRQSGYEKDLESRPPSVIVSGYLYTQAQGQALNTYLKNHPERYRQENIPDTHVIVLRRKDER